MKHEKQRSYRWMASCIFLACLGLQVTGQPALQDSLQEQLSSYRKHALQEKLFVHTDKSFYVAGETIWFKIYAVDASFHMPLSLSKVAYAEILDRQHLPVLQAKIAMQDASGNGSFFLPASLASGNFRFRAYTSWMKNYPAEYFFEKEITIVNAQQLPATGPVMPVAYEASFFPEGGNLVQGIHSRLAFKVTDQYGRGVACTGAIIDDRNDTLLRFTPLVFGMGQVAFTPAAGRTYRAMVTPPGAGTITKALPAAYPEGYVMTLGDTVDGRVSITVRSNIAAAQQVYLLAHTRLSIKAAAAAAFRDGAATFFIDQDKLGEGITHFTVFDAACRPVCERLYFHPAKDRLELKINTDQPEYGIRSKVALEVLASARSGKTPLVNGSMAVYRLDPLQAAGDPEMAAYFLLGSDLRGRVESPGYYFDPANAQRSAALDNLLLTQGWRRFSWEDVLHRKRPSVEFPPEYNGHIVTARVVDSATGSAVAQAEAYCSVPGIRTRFVPALSDQNGIVRFEMKGMYGSSEVILQTNRGKDSTARIEVADPFSGTFSGSPLQPFRFTETNRDALLEHFVASQVQDIYSGDHLKQFTAPASDTMPFYLHSDFSYLLDDYTRFVTLEEVLSEYIKLVNIKKPAGRRQLAVYDEGAKQMLANPLVLLDGVRVFDIDKFLLTDPLKIKKVDVLTRKFVLGPAAFNGILNWTTYQGDLGNYELDPGTVAASYEGLQLHREFYAPEYRNETQVASHLPDFRRLLYWSPDIHTNEQGRQHLDFYTSDVAGKYVIVVQAITADGRCATGTQLFDVKDNKPGQAAN